MGLCAFVICVVALLSANVAGAQQPRRDAADFDLGRSIEILSNIMYEFDTQYVDSVSSVDMLSSAVAGLTKATDPYSEYLSEQSMESFEVMTTGKYGGVGSLIRKKGDYVIFAQPYKGSPADEAGVKVGDKILAIDGKDMKGAMPDVISSHLKGDPESDVQVVIERNFDSSVDTLTIRRRRIAIPSIPYSGIVRDGIGYICHNDFIDGSYDEMRRHLEALMATDSLRGLILDYRTNGGGVMQEAVDIASLFVPRSERIVSIMGRDSSSLMHFATTHAPLAEQLPIVILVSGSSASASEILAGAFQDTDRAVVMGQRTYGKGLVQGTRYVGYNSYLKYTTAKYYIPSGRCIQARDYASRRSDGSVGMVPDSLINEYVTRAGRKVYDGGGIVPDVKVEPQYVSRFAVTLYAMGYIEDWADDYMRRHATESIDIRNFSLSDEEYEGFVEYISQKDVPYESETRRAIVALEKALENDLYDQTLGEAVAQIKERVKDDKLSNMRTYKDEIVDILISEILMRYAYNEAALEYAAVHDDLVNQAVELLLNGDEYRRILREQDLTMH
jgi:carboxyl-terminal processing protease